MVKEPPVGISSGGSSSPVLTLFSAQIETCILVIHDLALIVDGMSDGSPPGCVTIGVAKNRCYTLAFNSP